jgi:hypothetical protein
VSFYNKCKFNSLNPDWHTNRKNYINYVRWNIQNIEKKYIIIEQYTNEAGMEGMGGGMEWTMTGRGNQLW